MPGPDTLLAFLGLSMLLTIAPGPDNLMVLSLSVARGRREGLGFALGCALGCLSHTLWASLGVSALVLASPRLFLALRLAGAGYLLWLGIQALARPRPVGQVPPQAGDARRQLRRGFVANAINPKVGLFFLAFLPQFADPLAGPPGPQLLLLGLLFALQTSIVFSALAWSAAGLSARLRSQPGWSAGLERCAGGIFVALALRLAVGSGPT